MPDVPPALDQVAALRVANAGLRKVIEAKDTETRVLPEPVEALSAHVAELRVRSGLAELIEAAVGRKAGQARAQVAAPQVRAQARPAEGPAGCDAGDDRSPCGGAGEDSSRVLDLPGRECVPGADSGGDRRTSIAVTTR